MPRADSSKQRLALVALVVLVILVGTLVPGDVRKALLGRFPRRLHVDLIAHALCFGALAFLLRKTTALRPLHVVVLALALAVGTEVAQGFIPGRRGLVSDVAVDMAGALAGLGLAWRRKLREQRSSAGP